MVRRLISRPPLFQADCTLNARAGDTAPAVSTLNSITALFAATYEVGKDTPNAPPIIMNNQSLRVVLCAGAPL
ncbi:MAG TPA: hypothetical protein VD794_10250 [Flavisolibacter sp.]|nr:hypothetical protein [Flavisolibacter sp.]